MDKAWRKRSTLGITMGAATDLAVGVTADRPAVFVEVLTDEGKAEADRAREAAAATAVATAVEARTAFDAVNTQGREVQETGGPAVDQDAYTLAYRAAQDERARLEGAEAEARRRVHRVVEVGEDYFT